MGYHTPLVKKMMRTLKKSEQENKKLVLNLWF